MPQSWKILLVIETGGGGSGRHVIDLMRELSTREHDVHLIYSAVRIDAGFSDALEALNTVENIHMENIPMRRAPHPADLVATLRIRNYIKKYGPFDVIHGHSSKGGALARMAALTLPGVRVYTPHAFRTLDISIKPLAKLIYASIERALGTITDGFILVSDEEKAHALQCKLPVSKLFVVENGLSPITPLPAKTVRKDWGITDEICMGFVGRLAPQKNPHLLIEGFSRMRSDKAASRLIILGDGPLKPELQAFAQTLGIEQHITWISSDNAPALMSGFDLFVMPSRYEAFPYVLLEATAAGLPLITTPVGGTAALLENGINGILVGHEQVDALAQAMDQLVLSAELRKTMGDRSRQISENYTIETMTDKIGSVYQQLLSS